MRANSLLKGEQAMLKRKNALWRKLCVSKSIGEAMKPRDAKKLPTSL